jgi:hypothetical protein
MRWYELRLTPGLHVGDFYQRASELWPCEQLHHFWDEPWWPDAYIVRINTDASAPFLASLSGVSECVLWDSSEDEQAFGPAWDSVAYFFHASSMLANQDPRMALKLVHCFLNARGMSERDEARFAARLLWNRLTIKLRWRLYLRRRWEDQQRPGVAA